VAAQDKRPADGALVGGDVALGVMSETRAPARDEKAVTAAFCLIIGWWRRGANARKQAAAPAAGTEMARAATQASGASFGLGAPGKVPLTVDYPRAAVQRAYDSAGKAASAESSAHGALCEQKSSEANEAAAGGSGKDAPG
jgi:hypothetical protein